MEKLLIDSLNKHNSIQKYRLEKLQEKIAEVYAKIIPCDDEKHEKMIHKTFSKFLIERKGWQRGIKQKIGKTEFLIEEDKILFRPPYAKQFKGIFTLSRGYSDYNAYSHILPTGFNAFLVDTPIFSPFISFIFKDKINIKNLKYLSKSKIKKSEDDNIYIDSSFSLYEIEDFLTHDSVYNQILDKIRLYGIAIEKYNLEVMEHLKKVQAHLDNFETFLVTFKLQEGK